MRDKIITNTASIPSLNKNKFATLLLIIALLTLLLFPQNSHSAIIEAGDSTSPKDRIRTCSADAAGQNVTIEPLSGILGDDVEIDFDNPYCGGPLFSSYSVFKITQYAINRACGVNENVSPYPSLLQDIKRMVKARKAITQGPCAAAMTAAATDLAAVSGHLGLIRDIAADVFPRVKICGSDWNKYDPSVFEKSFTGTSQSRINWMNDPQNKPNAQGLIRGKPYSDYQQYREWYYGGVEKEYEGCKDPNRQNLPQRYYFRGYQPAIYNCNNYNIRGGVNPTTGAPLTEQEASDYREAYDCCKKISLNHICIEYDATGVYASTMDIATLEPTKELLSYQTEPNGDITETVSKAALCEATDQNKPELSKLCGISNVQFTAHFEAHKTMICASSYSLCPYNFNIGGGNLECDPFVDSTEITAEDIKNKKCGGKGSEVRNNDCSPNGKAGKCKNYCQPLEHCVLVDQNNYTYNSTITSPYFSDACINFIGDSQNSRGYGMLDAPGGKQSHFSAPIAQCVRETIENVFFNKAGHTKCRSSLEYPNKKGDCATPNYLYKKGEFVEGEVSFFNKLQSQLKTVIQLVLVMSVMFTGYKIMSGNQDALKRKELISYIVKIAVVMYFVTGQAWQTFFFNGIYNASTAVSTVVFKITTPSDPEKRDGCQFGPLADDFGYAVASHSYPPGKSYLAVWDTMDCKIARYLSIGMEADFTNYAMLVAASFLSGAIGVAFAVLLLVFGVTLIVATIKMLHIFLMSSITIILLVYLSIVIMPLMLFKKTEDLFNKWLANLISLSLQPIILFAYIGIFVAVFDNVLTGSATFYGTPPADRIISCEDRCFNPEGTEKSIEDCDLTEDKLIKPMQDSVACIIGGKNPVSDWPGLELFGIAIPTLTNLFTAEGQKIVVEQVKTLVKGALLIYILSSFISTIPETAQTLMGGVAMRMADTDVKNLMTKIYSGVSAAATRGRRLAKKAGNKGLDKVKSAARSGGSKGTPS